MPKRKSKFNEELQQKYPFFRKGRDEFEAGCITCGYGTFVSVANKGKLNLDMHVDSSKYKNCPIYIFLFIGIINLKNKLCICTNYQKRLVSNKFSQASRTTCSANNNYYQKIS